MKHFYNLLNAFVITILLITFFSLNPIQSYSQKITGGPFTIGVGQDYETIQDAVDSLELKGISGDVVFNLVDAMYNERVGINEIPGTAPDSTVTFQSLNENADEVLIYSGATNGSSINWVIEFAGCDYVTIQYVTIQNTTQSSSYTRVISFYTTSTNNKLLHNKLFGESGSPTGDNEAVIQFHDQVINNTEIMYNEITGGSQSARFDGNQYGPDYSTGVKFNYNTCNSTEGVFFEFMTGIEVVGNEINMSSSTYALYLLDCDQQISVMNNIIHTSSTSAHQGLYLNGCNAGFNFEGTIANNEIYIGGNGDYNDANKGIECVGTSYQEFYHNTIFVKESNSSGYGFKATDGSELILYNNIIACDNMAFVIHSNNGANITACDYNGFYTHGNYFGQWNGSNLNDLASFQGTTTFDDSHSVFVFPNFASVPDNLIPTTHWLDDGGTDLNDIIDYDLDSVARPDISI